MQRAPNGCSPNFTPFSKTSIKENAERAVFIALLPKPDLYSETRNSMPFVIPGRNTCLYSTSSIAKVSWYCLQLVIMHTYLVSIMQQTTKGCSPIFSPSSNTRVDESAELAFLYHYNPNQICIMKQKFNTIIHNSLKDINVLFDAVPTAAIFLGRFGLHEAISTSFALNKKLYLSSPSPIRDRLGGLVWPKVDEFP